MLIIIENVEIYKRFFEGNNESILPYQFLIKKGLILCDF